jgi:hypothetical protein
MELAANSRSCAREILEAQWVHGTATCIVIKGKGLRAEQFVSLSKQRGKNLAIKLGKEFGWVGDWSGGREATLDAMSHGGMDLVLCQWT